MVLRLTLLLVRVDVSGLRLCVVSSEDFSTLEATYADTRLYSRYHAPGVARPQEGLQVVHLVVRELWGPLSLGWWKGTLSYLVA